MKNMCILMALMACALLCEAQTMKSPNFIKRGQIVSVQTVIKIDGDVLTINGKKKRLTKNTKPIFDGTGHLCGLHVGRKYYSSSRLVDRKAQP